MHSAAVLVRAMEAQPAVVAVVVLQIAALVGLVV